MINLDKDFKMFNMDEYIRSNNFQGWDKSFGTNDDLYKITQLVSRTDFPDFISEVILEGMEEVFEVELIGKEMFQDMGVSSPNISWLEEHGFDAQILGEGEAPRKARLRHAKKTFRPIKIGLGLEFTHAVLRDVDKMDTLGRHTRRVARAMAYKENQYLLSVALNSVADGSNRHMTGEVYDSHIFDATHASWQASQVAAASGSMDIQKINVGTQVLTDEGFNADKIFASPSTVTTMLSLEEFRSTYTIQYLSKQAEAILEGRTRKPYFLPGGLTLYENREIPDGLVLMIDSQEFGGYWEVEGLATVELPENLARVIDLGFYNEPGAVGMKPGAAVLFNNVLTTTPATFQT
jgi:hypothetical protein